MSRFAVESSCLPATPDALRALIEQRRAVRRFLDEPVADEILRDCLEQAVLAPNACNLQPWSFQVIRDPELRRRLVPVCLGQNAARTAPVLIAVLARPDTWRESCAAIIEQWPEPQVPEKIRDFYQRTAPFQYNQGAFGLRGLFKRVLYAFVGQRRALMRQPNSHAEMRLWAVKSTALAAQNLMLALQSHGLATCPMEGFDEVRLRKVLEIPRRAVPIMLLAVGRAAENGVYNPRLRFPLEQRVSWH
ncbi:nitroreductase family protein [Pseudomonas sp. ZM23]|uniref:Nitroreductase family protein n=1 Tax=Pseudomonas triclosanedens TaxID=2961893 RepID=A0ABY6ZUG6_9PSED|nr:nitroreductase family protein [Pseudomonas triclosanedens]MCP8463214.1 nitroreductase family protein [Pseudomonas triclosanedens]MCP8469727.1 nitroreductase family protein [Pseudomonas triclosanedens]MCP8474015.1 nitroreductase family protein [Pseudomonas triclosanedens]WAI48587.1 nitroreductase family protein [Pseudomonas triclosanedens]